MRALTRFSFLAALAATASCDERRDSIPTMPLEISPDALSAYVVVSNPSAPVGSEVTVTVRSLRGKNVAPIGSFTIRLAYDSIGLAFGKAAASAQGMVLANASQRGLVVAAGAASDGFRNDELFSATFVVNAPGGLKSLALTINELNSLAFEDQRATMHVMKGIYRAPAATP